MSVNLVMRIFFIFFIILILNIQNLYAAGKGELKLDKSTMEHFLSYLYGGGSANLSDSKNLRGITPLMIFKLPFTSYSVMFLAPA